MYGSRRKLERCSWCNLRNTAVCVCVCVRVFLWLMAGSRSVNKNTSTTALQTSHQSFYPASISLLPISCPTPSPDHSQPINRLIVVVILSSHYVAISLWIFFFPFLFSDCERYKRDWDLIYTEEETVEDEDKTCAERRLYKLSELHL